MFSLSVCMIVKDEELVIDRVLKCAKKFADEIIVVDTGSKDNTINICKKYTPNVYNFVWQDDFALARNYSFSKATKDYIMWLDADDYITIENIDKINQLKKVTNPADVYMLKYVMGFENGKPTFEFFRERIVKNNGKYLWSGFVHEVITPSGKIEYLDIKIEHRKEKQNPPMRNLKIYRKALKSKITFNPREQYYYSRELFYNNYIKKAILELKKYLNMLDIFLPNIYGANIMLGECYIKLKEYKKAVNIMMEFCKNHTPNPEFCCTLAHAYDCQKNTNQAIFWYTVALISPQLKDGFIQKDYEEYIPCIELCRLYFPFDYPKSKEFFERAKKLKPHSKSIEYNEQFFK